MPARRHRQEKYFNSSKIAGHVACPVQDAGFCAANTSPLLPSNPQKTRLFNFLWVLSGRLFVRANRLRKIKEQRATVRQHPYAIERLNTSSNEETGGQINIVQQVEDQEEHEPSLLVIKGLLIFNIYYHQYNQVEGSAEERSKRRQ